VGSVLLLLTIAFAFSKSLLQRYKKDSTCCHYFSLFFVMVLKKEGFSFDLDRNLALKNANYLPFHRR